MARTITVIVVVAVVGAVAAVLYGRIAWRRSTDRLRARMEEARVQLPPTVYDPTAVRDLPPPVRRYFGLVLVPGQPIITGAVLEQAGTFNMSETGERWHPFTATQQVVTRRPQFVWDARIAMAPVVPVRVHDAYVAGRGLLKAAVFGLAPVAHMADTPQLGRDELMRFLAEAVWYPTALLPGQGVKWEARDSSSALATLTDGGHVVVMTFEFGDDGLVATVRADARGRVLGDTIVETPWEGRWEDYERIQGMMIPTRGEVAWIDPSGRQPYWRGRLVEVDYRSQ